MSPVSDAGPIPDATVLCTFVWPKAIHHRSLGQRPRTDVGESMQTPRFAEQAKATAYGHGRLLFISGLRLQDSQWDLTWGVQFAAVEWSALCLFLFQSRRDDPKTAQGGAHVSGANVAQPWDSKTLDRRTPKGWP